MIIQDFLVLLNDEFDRWSESQCHPEQSQCHPEQCRFVGFPLIICFDKCLSYRTIWHLMRFQKAYTGEHCICQLKDPLCT